MKVPSQLIALAGRFDRLSFRERLCVLLAAIAVLIVAFNSLLTNHLDVHRTQLLAQLSDLESGMTLEAKNAASEMAADPTSAAYARAADLKVRLAAVDSQLEAQSSAMIPAKRMAEVIQDVLRLKRGVVLVSLRTLPAKKLAPEPQDQNSTGIAAPYVHSVELVVEGSYLDVLSYLQALESLPWRIYWRQLDLNTTHYPVNRVRLELGTVSMDSDWLGL